LSLPNDGTQGTSVQLFVVGHDELSKKGCSVAKNDVAALLSPLMKANSLKRFDGLAVRKSVAIWSYGHEKSFKAILRYGQMILFEGSDVTLNGLFDIVYGLFFGMALANTPRQTGAFRDPVAVFSWED
jgi:hypothetical protein